MGFKIYFCGGLIFLALTVFSLFTAPVCAITVYSGDTAPLSGAASGTDYVYLFLTGPNLPYSGVSLDDISSSVQTGDSSTFTRVNVRNYRWSYDWDTSTAGGVPDPGNYIVYAVNNPTGRGDLSDEEYSYIQVKIVNPSLSASAGSQGITTVTETTWTLTNYSTEIPSETQVAVSSGEQGYEYETDQTRTEAAGETVNPDTVPLPEQTEKSPVPVSVIISAVFAVCLIVVVKNGRR
ncbi:hypothetical protein J2128_000842 [Methanomicrobium sp. W14]|uniref:hypothetical protein n=1 Tax=Methanomicrobium sp. W14 TaxID=2817839 RepID=UPI001AE3C5EB|nr:hypothetical protein [Methanomicrobium sp. W14]MBP2132921.1 hypothetical protein [Methanomicrobium sp. W14]